MRASPGFSRTMVLALACSLAPVSGCGSDKGDDDDGDNGLPVPASIITEAQLQPGTLLAMDAEKIKAEMESAGGSFKAHSEDTDDAASCFNTAFSTLKAKAKGDTLVIDGEIDFSACYAEEFKKSTGFENADYTAFVAVSKTRMVSYTQCEGQDLSAYDGKAITEIKNIPECNKAATVKVLSESSGSVSLSGTIKDVVVGGQKFVYVVEQESSEVSVTRTAAGGVCVSNLNGAEYTYEDGCLQVSRNVNTKGKTGIQGQETEEDNLGKADYEKLEYVGIRELADDASVWYAGGKFNVTRNDWTGTVTYSSATAEPIFEMKKGSETVTGTIKAKETEDE